MSKKVEKEKKTAIKIINNYADKYNMIMEENENLRQEINDLRANIKLNKEIMASFYSQSKNSKDNVIEKLKEENKNLYNIIEKTSKERDLLKKKMLQIEENIDASIGKITEENNNLSTKLFLAEQELSKKSTTITLLKKKIANSKNKYFKDEEEYYIIEPSEAIIQINDELFLYKEIYSKLISSLKRCQKSITKYEMMITNLQNELMKVKNKYRLSVLSANREKENYLSILSQNTRNATTENSKKNNSNNLPNVNIFPSDDFRIKTKFKLENGNFYANVHSLDEFSDILKSVGLTKTEFQKMSKLKTYSKLTDAIEMIFGILIDKNTTIKILQTENDNLTNKNFVLNKENMALNFEIKKYKDINDNISSNDRDGTLSNNMSNITPNRLDNIDALQTYQRLLERQRQDDDLQREIDDLDLSYSSSSKKNNDTTSENYEEIIRKYVMESNSLNFESSQKK